MKKIKKFLLYFCVILLPIFLLLINVKLVVFDEDFYEKEYVKNGVYEKIDKEVVWGMTNNLFDYFKGGSLDDDLFNEKERLHMEDVKGLYNFGNFLFYSILLLLVICLFIFKKESWKMLVYGSLLGFLSLLVVSLLVYYDFSSFFVKFHEILFNNEYWMMDPLKDNLVVLFSEGFFIDFFVRVIRNTGFIGLVCLISGFLIKGNSYK